MLTADEIMEKIKKGDIVIKPFNEKQLNPNSYNITLNNRLLVYDCDVIDLKKNNKVREIIIPEEGLVLKPNVLYLGRTNEYTETHNLVPGIDGRSSIGRHGISIHITAGFGDVGFKGTWTLEISCVQPVRIYPNIEIGQLYYEEITGNATKEYNGRYQGQIDATPSRLFKDYENKPSTEE